MNLDKVLQAIRMSLETSQTLRAALAQTSNKVNKGDDKPLVPAGAKKKIKNKRS